MGGLPDNLTPKPEVRGMKEVCYPRNRCAKKGRMKREKQVNEKEKIQR